MTREWVIPVSVWYNLTQYMPSQTGADRGKRRQITLWAEREHNMMQHFFNSLRQWAAKSDGSDVNRQAEVQVRLHFLCTVFCSLGSPEHFRSVLGLVRWADVVGRYLDPYLRQKSGN